MTTDKTPKKMLVIFPIFVALFPIIHLYRENVDKVEISVVAPTIFYTLITLAVGWAAIAAMTKSVRKGGLIVSWLFVLFSFYYTYDGWIIQIVLVLLISNWLIYFIVISKSDFRGFVAFMNVSSFVAIAIPGYSIIMALLNPPPMEIRQVPDVLSQKQIDMKGTTPNVYFIILDGYGGQKALEEFYTVKNSSFISFLEDQGFWVSKASRSNYMRTVLSLPATLNMEYLDEFIEMNELEESKDERPFAYLLRWNYVKGFLMNMGYESVGISSGFAGWDMIGADHFLNQRNDGMNQFRAMLHSHTPVYPILRELAFEDPFAKHRELQIQTIEAIGDIPDMFDTPIFTFAHILSPHPPFVFDADGELIHPREPRFHLGDGTYVVGATMDVSEYRMQYIAQMAALNRLLEVTIRKLREKDPGAIIIIQGDHGPGAQLVWGSIEETNLLERSSILNAIYLPKQDYDDLYDTMSSVNTFRFIFNKYFGAEHEILPDLHYFSESQFPYYMLQVTFEDEDPQHKQFRDNASAEVPPENVPAELDSN